MPPQVARIKESDEIVPEQKGALALRSPHPGLCTGANIECRGPQSLPVAQSVSAEGQEIEAVSKILGRSGIFRPSRLDVPLWRRKGSWCKVYQRTSLPPGTKASAYLGAVVRKETAIKLGEAG